MSDQKVYPVKPEFADSAWINNEKYLQMYQQSVINPEGFWREQAEQRIDWIKPFTRVRNVSFDDHNVNIKWFEDGTLNASANCLDRHLETRGDQTAIIWEGDDPGQDRHITYKELHEEVSRFANALRGQGVRKGDIVCIYMPMIPEAAVAMLACTRIGAVHSVVFGGFSPDALAGRIEDSNAKIVITSDEGVRGGKKVPLKANVDEALTNPAIRSLEKVIVVKRTGSDVAWHPARDVWYHDLVSLASPHCPAEEMGAEDPLFILYTSGSTGKPKGVLHTTGGYMVWASITHQYVFDYHDGDIYWCTADVGWITGHTYLLYGPLANGGTTLMCEGVPNYPDINRFSQIVDKHQVNILYTAPTAIRSLMAEGAKAVEGTHRESLRLLGSVGEPINPEAWEWYYRTIGEERCPIVDTWWQTETGGIMITPLPGATDAKPGSATRPFFGVQPALVDNSGMLLEGAVEGNLVMIDSWPGQARTVYGDHERFVQTYFSTFRGMYFTGDGARRDEDGYYWITGRVDDVINVSGHRMGTAEVESALVAHPKVAEAAVVGYPHDIKGQGIYVYVTLNAGEESSEELVKELRNWVRAEIGPIAAPDLIQITPGLPKTRSGKIMRRILRKIAANEHDSLGDISTLADPSVVESLIDKRLNRG
ncbi:MULTISPECIES: acetate--CoA ligase [unclassified Thalassolituus]|jgi:acetyl-CoA synthetase|uniref:acetate--CoA ligase n=1 Tax=Oceanospirillaceae TaxID=135620 RepID=UPI00119721FC|nr:MULTISPECIES: acetate--CoA ligase [unclassified Thalassolituus]MBU2037659.1 acetate--CoA ligase [Gammaproteobacteria bacterium]MCA6059595.1 acetate--CoA ligase [Thalassolituus sp. ST750PaO-4]TVV43277.1 acetate--CoA ligase [Thalassolituus sp. C2-1]